MGRLFGLDLQTSVQDGEHVPSFLNIYRLLHDIETQNIKRVWGIQLEIQTPNDVQLVSAHFAKVCAVILLS